MPRSQASKPTTIPRLNAVAGKVSAPDAGLTAGLVLGLLRGYKIFISPLFTGCCRYHPSCADYMKEAVLIHGVRRGVWLGIRRLSRCLPFGRHGFDPVPGA